jgi:hypothetical protein
LCKGGICLQRPSLQVDVEGRVVGGFAPGDVEREGRLIFPRRHAAVLAQPSSQTARLANVDRVLLAEQVHPGHRWQRTVALRAPDRRTAKPVEQPWQFIGQGFELCNSSFRKGDRWPALCHLISLRPAPWTHGKTSRAHGADEADTEQLQQPRRDRRCQPLQLGVQFVGLGLEDLDAAGGAAQRPHRHACSKDWVGRSRSPEQPLGAHAQGQPAGLNAQAVTTCEQLVWAPE